MDSTSTESALPASASSRLFDQLRKFLELIRFSHTVFALPFAGLACVLALVSPGRVPLTAAGLILRLFGVLLCMVFARSAAMAFNRLVDARIDAENPRTANRHIPAGQLTTRHVWIFFMLTSVGFFLSCLLFLPNWLPVAFALPVLVWVCGYSLAKRFTASAHLWLGVALALSPVCAWIALRGETVLNSLGDPMPAVALAVAIACWVAGFDIIYACQDADFDRKAGLHSIPAWLGVAGALMVAAVFHLLMLVILFLLPFWFPDLSLGWLYFAATALVAILIVRQHWIVRPDDLGRVGVAFFNINAIISLGFCSMAAIDALL